MEGSIDDIIAKVELSAEIARIALECPSCRKNIKRLIEGAKINVNPVRGHSSFAATNERNGDVSVAKEYYTHQYK